MEATTTTELCFSRDQLKLVLKDFVDLFTNGNFIHNLQHLAPNEDKMGEMIEQAQKQIFQLHGVDPIKGYKDLPRIREVYKNDNEILSLLVDSANKEDSCLTEAMKNPHTHGHSHGHGGHSGHQQPAQFANLPKLNMTFQQVYDMVLNIPPDQGPNPQQLEIIQAAAMQFPQDQKVQLTQLLMLRAGPEQRQLMRQQVDSLKARLSSIPAQHQQMVQMQITSMENMLAQVESMTLRPSTTTTTTTPQQQQSLQNVMSLQKPSSQSMSKD